MKAHSDQGSSPGPLPAETLDALQRSILWHFAHGKSSRQIARELAVSEATMRRALRRARVALGVETTTHAVYVAAKGGLI